MPTEGMSLNGAWLCDADGNKLAPWSGVQCVDISDDDTLPTNGIAIDFTNDIGKTFTFEFRWYNWMTARMMRQIYRWKARGPVRQRVIRKLLVQETRGYLKRGVSK